MSLVIEKPSIHISLGEEDIEFLRYVRWIFDKLQVKEKPSFLYLWGSNIFSSKESIQESAERFIGEHFEDFNLEVINTPIEAFIKSSGFNWIFLRYRRSLLRKALHERIIQSLDGVSLWIYKSPCSQEIRDICVPVDMSERSKKQVEFSQKLASFLNARIELLHALAISRMRHKVSQKEYDQLRSLKEEETMHIYGDLLHGKSEVLLKLIDGDPIKDLPKHINNQNCDLVVISRRSKQEVRPMGRHSLHIIRSVKCPVVVL